MAIAKIPKSKKLPLVSVVITTKNEEKNIANCLGSIKKQTYPKAKIEIIVVDNHSTDKTVNIARTFTERVLHKGPERSAQRNFGLSKAKGKYLMFLDADMLLSPNVIEKSVEKITKEQGIVGLYISEVVVGDGYWIQFRRFERSFYDGTAIDCVRFISADAFRKVGGFDITLTGPEDWDFDKKIRKLGKVDLVKDPIYHNETGFNLVKYLTKKGYYTQSFRKYIDKWGPDDPDVKKQFGPYYRSIGVFIEKRKFKRIIKQPFLFLGVLILRLLVGLTYVIKTKYADKPKTGSESNPLAQTRLNKRSNIVNPPTISIIIPTKNSSHVLPICLAGIKAQDYPVNQVEVIVVDNDSADNTITIAKKFSARTISISGKAPLVCQQRNLGAEKAKGKYLLFLDHDMELSSGLLLDFADVLNHSENDTKAWFIPEVIITANDTLTKLRNFERSFYNQTPVDAVRIIERSTFFKTQTQYDPQLSGGPADWDLDIQLKEVGCQFGTITKPLYHHEERLGGIPNYIFKKSDWWGGIRAYKTKWAKKYRGRYQYIIDQQLGLKYRIFNVFIEKGKWKRALKRPDLYLEVMFVKLAMLCLSLNK